jgi:hypothetical protein
VLKRERILGGMFFLAIGAFGVFLGARYLLSLEHLQFDSGLSCRVICGLGLLMANFFGENAGVLLVGSLLLTAGFFFIYFGFMLLSNRSRKVNKI